MPKTAEILCSSAARELQRVSAPLSLSLTPSTLPAKPVVCAAWATMTVGSVATPCFAKWQPSHLALLRRFLLHPGLPIPGFPILTVVGCLIRYCLEKMSRYNWYGDLGLEDWPPDPVLVLSFRFVTERWG